MTCDAAKGVPRILAPGTRICGAPEGESVDKLHKRSGLEEQSIDYLWRFKHGEELVRKLTEMK